MPRKKVYSRPLPRISELSRPFWEASREHRLVIQWCGACEGSLYPASPTCHRCWSAELEWREVSGRGVVLASAVYHRAFHPAFKEAVPYNVVLVELEEGPRIVSNLLPEQTVEIPRNLPVVACFEDVTPQITLVKFRRAGEE